MRGMLSAGTDELDVCWPRAAGGTGRRRLAVTGYRGRILQIGPPEALYRSPTDRTVAEFFGQVNWIPGITADGSTIETEIGKFAVDPTAHRGRVRIGVRPTELTIATSATDGPNEFAGTVLEETFFGEFLLIKIRASNDLIFTAKLQKHGHIGLTGRAVSCVADRTALLVFPEN